MDFSKIAVGISLLSFVVSLIVLWHAHLKPFKTTFSVGTPRMSMYKIQDGIFLTKKRNTWWIPSFDIPLTAMNLGSRSGEIKDVRLIVEIKDKVKTTKLYAYPKWVVNYSAFNRDRSSRFKWLETSVERSWYSTHLAGNQEKQMHIVLELDRFDEVRTGQLHLELQVATSEQDKWQSLDKFELFLIEDIYHSDSTYAPQNQSLEKLRKIA
ncbi:hypothetical protein [Vibrio metschnikovii]|uniref:hypothetical protein n=1 Tax=Vibrio metschnikovii TaxID=28172 RepID=UPI00165DB96A|nr:hypothetical protein [Vibrio metschnikovii]